MEAHSAAWLLAMRVVDPCLLEWDLKQIEGGRTKLIAVQVFQHTGSGPLVVGACAMHTGCGGAANTGAALDMTMLHLIQQTEDSERSAFASTGGSFVAGLERASPGPKGGDVRRDDRGLGGSAACPLPASRDD